MMRMLPYFRKFLKVEAVIPNKLKTNPNNPNHSRRPPVTAVIFLISNMKTKILFFLLFFACFTIQAQVPVKPIYIDKMAEILKGVPVYWKTSLDDVEKTVAGIKKGKVERVCLSPGGRPVYRIFYGKPNDLKQTSAAKKTWRGQA